LQSTACQAYTNAYRVYMMGLSKYSHITTTVPILLD